MRTTLTLVLTLALLMIPSATAEEDPCDRVDGRIEGWNDDDTQTGWVQDTTTIVQDGGGELCRAGTVNGEAIAGAMVEATVATADVIGDGAVTMVGLMVQTAEDIRADDYPGQFCAAIFGGHLGVCGAMPDTTG